MEDPKTFQGKLQLLYYLISGGQLNDIRLFKAFLELNLKEFVPLRVRKYIQKLHMGTIYEDTPTLFYFDREHPETVRTISAPHMIVIMLQNLLLKEDDDLLILGAKSGYISVLAHKMAPKGKIKILEANSRIAKITQKNIERLNLQDHIEVIIKNPLEGLPEFSPWQKILVTGAIETSEINTLLNQLDPEQGVLFAPIGGDDVQDYTQILRKDDEYYAEVQLQVRFTPLITQLAIDEFKLITDYDVLKDIETTEEQSKSKKKISIKYAKHIIDRIESEINPNKKKAKIDVSTIFKSLLENIDQTISELKQEKKIKNWKNSIDNFDLILKIFKNSKIGPKSYLSSMEKSIDQLKTYNFNVERFQNKHSGSNVEDLNIFQKRLDEIENFRNLIRKEIQIFKRD